MGFLIGLFYVLFTIAAIILVLLVLFRPSQSGGLSGAFGGMGGDTTFGVKATEVIDKVIAVTAGVFVLLAVLIAVLSERNDSGTESEGGSAVVAPAEPVSGDTRVDLPV